MGWHKLYNRRLSLFIWLHRKIVRYSMVLLSSLGRYWFLCNNCFHGYQLPWKLTYWSFVQNKACGVRSIYWIFNLTESQHNSQSNIKCIEDIKGMCQKVLSIYILYIVIAPSGTEVWTLVIYVCVDQPVWINGKKAFSYFWVFCIYLSDQFTG